MEIKISEEAIQKSVQESADKAIECALGGYDVRQAIGKAITEEVASGALRDALRLAVEGIDKERLTKALCAEMQKAITKAVVMLLHEGVVEVVAKLRGVTEYGHDRKDKLDAIRAELGI
jgi:hypothetical protein